MAYGVPEFRTTFPEFGDADTFPDLMITPRLPVSTAMVDSCRWGEVYDYGRYLLAAHRLVLGKRASDTAEAGGTPGQSTGMLSAKALDKASMSFDTASAAEEGAGWYNLTTYGQEFWRLSQMFSGGAIQL